MYSEDESGPQSTKKPVVMETYNEIVFPDPSEVFYARVQKHPAVIVPRLPVTLNLPSGNALTVHFTLCCFLYLGIVCNILIFAQLFLVPNIEDLNEKKGDTKDHPLSQWFINFSEADELLKLAAARQQVRLLYFLNILIG